MRTAVARWIGLTVLLTGLTILVTWPQVPRLADGVSDYGDPLYNAWALAWTAHALADPHDTLFDANIFHPEPNTLALTETILLPAVLVAPLAWTGTGPIALHNIVLLSSFVLSGLSMFLLVRSLTADAGAATVAAAAFALTPIRFDQYSHLQLQLTYLMPLALYFLHGAVREGTGSRWRAVGLGASLGGLFLSCVYYTVFFATLLMVFTPVLLASTRPLRLRARVWPAGVAAIVAAVVAAPVAMAYQRNRAVAADRRIEDVARGSAAAADYLRSQNWNLLYGDPGRRGPAERNLFTGYTVPVLAAGALVASPLAAAPYAAAAAVGFDASLGVNGWTYPALYRLLSPYRTLRVPARFAMLVAMFLAVLAGLGVSALRQRCRVAWRRHAILACALAGLVAESVNRPLPLASMPAAIPGVYEYLATLPPGPVFEYPISHLEGRAGPQDATYMYYSTAHWQPLLNGYSSFAPASYFELRDRMESFPQPEAVAYLIRRDARYVLAHERFYFRGGFEEDVAALEAMPALRRLATFREARHLRSVVFEVVGYGTGGKP